MNKRTVLACLLAAALGACAQAPMHTSPRTKAEPAPPSGKLVKEFAPDPLTAGVCTRSYCQLEVGVKMQGGRCTPKLDDLTIVTRRGVEVRWIITAPGWTWPQRDGIEFKRGGHPFGNSSRDSDIQWSVKNNAATRGFWDYNVALVNAKGETCKVDPGLVTDWSSEPPPE